MIPRALRYAFYDWTREMPIRRRIATWAGILIQGYALYAAFLGSLIWPLLWPKGPMLLIGVVLLYGFGSTLMNAMLSSEFIRKTQLESDQIAARQIQQTLQPGKLVPLPGYKIESFYHPFRDVGGDYFDVIELPGDRTLFALADVSGKGMAAALLSANIQALVRTIANVEDDPITIARLINAHLSRYTPTNRFATAVFLILSRETGQLIYVNAGHNPPLLFAGGSARALTATGLPLGLLQTAEYTAGSATVPPGGSLLVFTDGLTDAIAGDDPEQRLVEVLARSPTNAMHDLQSLVETKLNEDDVTILLVKRLSHNL